MRASHASASAQTVTVAVRSTEATEIAFERAAEAAEDVFVGPVLRYIAPEHKLDADEDP